MSPSLICAAVWMLVANVSAMIPSRDNLWQRAYILMGIGLPLLGWVIFQNGPWIGMIVLAAGASVLRWPLVYLGRWLRRIMGS